MTGATARVFAACLLLSVFGCGDDDGEAGCIEGPSGCVDVDAGGIDEIAPPDIPWLADGTPSIAAPALAPCPDGWREVVSEASPTTCEPYPEGGVLDCPDGQAHFPGEPGCAPVGSVCPASEFSEVLPADRNVVYVQPGATGGDGSSPTLPHGSLMEFAVSRLPRESVIALSRGTHQGSIRLVRGIALWGACAADTILTTSAPSELEGVVTIRDDEGALRDLTIADSPRLGAVVSGSAGRGTLDGVVVTGAESLGVLVDAAAQLTARDVLVRDTRARARDLAFGLGLNVQLGGMASMRRALLVRNRGVGVRVSDAGSVTLADILIHDTQSRLSDGQRGVGVSVLSGASADVDGALIDLSRDHGVNIEAVGSTLRLANAIVRRTQPQEGDGDFGRGLGIESGAGVEVTRVLFDENHQIGAFVGDTGTMTTFGDVIFGRTGAAALEVERGAMVTAQRALFADNRRVAAIVNEMGATLTMTDVVIRDTVAQPGADPTRGSGRGMNVQLGATAAITRGRFDDNDEIGVFTGWAGASVRLTDVVVRRDAENLEGGGKGGRGLGAQDGGAVVMTRALFEHSRDYGLVVGSGGASLTAQDVIVRDTNVRTCAETTCREEPGGQGVAAYADASLSMTRFIVSRAELCGLQLALNGSLELADGEVCENPIGVCVQVEGLDVAGLLDDLHFTDNEDDIQTTDLPVPAPTPVAPTSP